jgi:hypothetical protein
MGWWGYPSALSCFQFYVAVRAILCYIEASPARCYVRTAIDVQATVHRLCNALPTAARG